MTWIISRDTGTHYTVTYRLLSGQMEIFPLSESNLTSLLDVEELLVLELEGWISMPKILIPDSAVLLKLSMASLLDFLASLWNVASRPRPRPR